MVACKHFSPGEDTVNEYPAAEMAEGYIFNRPLKHNSCSQPELSKDSPHTTTCFYAGKWSDCHLSVPDEVEVLAAYSLEGDGSTQSVRLEHGRNNKGVPSYSVVVNHTVTTGEETSFEVGEHELTSITPLEDEEDGASLQTAMDFMNEYVKTRMDSTRFSERSEVDAEEFVKKEEDKPKVSYMQKVAVGNV